MPKTLMSFPRLSYGFSFILHLNMHFYSLISDLCSLCEYQVERAVIRSILGSREQKCKELAGTSRRPNVMTSQRRNVGSTKIEVNKRQRRDVETSRRQRDFCLSIIKRKKGPEFSGIKDRTNEGTKIRTAAT